MHPTGSRRTTRSAAPVLTAHRRKDSPLDWRGGPEGVPSLTAKGLLIPRPWIDHPYGEEEIALLEEELLPAMAVFLARVDAIDRAIEADQELEVQAHQAR